MLQWQTLGAFSGACLGAWLCIELGFRFGRFSKNRSKRPTHGILGTAISAHLGLVAFLLAFTFGLAATRLGERRNLVIDEANAIGTAGLRATALPEPHSTNVRRILAEYTELRAVLLPQGKIGIEEATARNERLTNELWAETRLAVLEGKPSEPYVTQFAVSVNEVIDTGSKRYTVVFRHHIPPIFWDGLALIGILCAIVLGYHSGAEGSARPWILLPLVISLAAVIMLVVDMDSPSGLVRLGQQPMLDALKTLRAPAPSGN